MQTESIFGSTKFAADRTTVAGGNRMLGFDMIHHISLMRCLIVTVIAIEQSLGCVSTKH